MSLNGPQNQRNAPRITFGGPSDSTGSNQNGERSGRDQNNVGPKVYPIILRLGSPLSLNMARKTLNSLEDKAFQLTPIAVQMTKLATTEELPDEFVVVTVK